MTHFTAVIDACVLFPFELRDAAVRLARTGLFRAKWTERIHDEWTRSLLAKNPDYADRLERTRTLINRAVPDCLVDGYDDLIPSLELPDPDDRHVLAAAIRCKADVIVTFNMKDFPADVLRAFGIEPVHPDDFVMANFDLDADAVCTMIREQAADYRRPVMSADDLLDRLSRQGLKNSAVAIRAHLSSHPSGGPATGAGGHPPFEPS